MQKIIQTDNTIEEIEQILNDLHIIKYFLVCGSSIKKHDINDFLLNDQRLSGIFSDYSSNPKFEDICNGVQSYIASGSNCIISIGGGSSIDVAKCIKIFSKINDRRDYLKKSNSVNSDILISIPTTAGSGSESTKFAAIYVDSEKKSIENNSALPDYVILNSSYLAKLPKKYKVCAMMDALCQSIEAWWSVNSTKESIEFSRKAIELIISNMDNYIEIGDKKSSDNILFAANLSGRAINISKTTAAHAMSYKLTMLYNIPHGCSVALLLPRIWEYMISNLDKCTDKRGKEYLCNVFQDISKCFRTDDPKMAIAKFNSFLIILGIEYPYINKLDLVKLVESVNTERMQNNPVSITKHEISALYSKRCFSMID